MTLCDSIPILLLWTVGNLTYIYNISIYCICTLLLILCFTGTDILYNCIIVMYYFLAGSVVD